MKKNAFTLIELIAVLVILAILALIVTPLVMNIIRKARVAADKRSIDAYGRSIELAIANYLLDNGDFPDSISDLTIEYSGDQVVCSTTQLNGDSSVYLTGCTVGGRSVDYAYGTNNSPSYTAYSIGDEVTYNNVDYYVIADSRANESTVSLLKSEPLSYTETQNYAMQLNIQVTEENGYGAVQYGETSNYNNSYVKKIIDNWTLDKVESQYHQESRLMTADDFLDNLGFELQNMNPTTDLYKYTSDTPSWVYDVEYDYWTMTPDNMTTSTVNPEMSVLRLSKYYGALDYGYVDRYYTIRPVITISKSALSE